MDGDRRGQVAFAGRKEEGPLPPLPMPWRGRGHGDLPVPPPNHGCGLRSSHRNPACKGHHSIVRNFISPLGIAGLVNQKPNIFLLFSSAPVRQARPPGFSGLFGSGWLLAFLTVFYEALFPIVRITGRAGTGGRPRAAGCGPGVAWGTSSSPAPPPSAASSTPGPMPQRGSGVRGGVPDSPHTEGGGG